MAFYYESIEATTNVSPAKDKDTELATFVSYYLDDWATKVGSNYAVYQSGHADWTTATSFTNTTLPVNISLIGPPGRAGTDPDGENMGFTFQISCNLYIYSYRGWFADAGANNGTGDHRTESAIATQTGTLCSSGGYTTPATSSVWYSDTAGSRYFAWRLLNSDNLVGVITELDDVGHIPLVENVGWGNYYPNNENQFLGRTKPTSSSEDSNPWAARIDAEDYLPAPNNFTTTRWFNKNLPQYNTAMGYMGHSGDTLIRSSFEGVPYAAVNYNAAQYVCIGDHLWVKTS